MLRARGCVWRLRHAWRVCGLPGRANNSRFVAGVRRCRDVKVMRQRPASGDEWNSFLQQWNLAPQGSNREALREQFCKQVRGYQKDLGAARYRKPADAYCDDGTPRAQAESALPPYPSDAAAVAGDGIGADADTDSKGADRSEPSLLNLGNFLGSDPDAGGSSRKRARRERQFSEGIRQRFPEAKLYTQLQELERKVDSISARKRMQVEEALKHPVSCTRTLQIIMWNTHEHQAAAADRQREHSETASSAAQAPGDAQVPGAGAKPSWTLFITGRLVDSSGQEVKGQDQATLASLLERVFIQLPAHLYPDSHAIEWSCWDGGAKGKKAVHEEGAGDGPTLGLRIKRQGSEECKVRVMLHCSSNPKRFSLSGNPELGELLGFESGSWSQLLLAFWTYVQQHNLHSDDDVRDPCLNACPWARARGNMLACVRGVGGRATHVWVRQCARLEMGRGADGVDACVPRRCCTSS